MQPTRQSIRPAATEGVALLVLMLRVMARAAWRAAEVAGAGLHVGTGGTAAVMSRWSRLRLHYLV